jgi:hypothetical protein
MSTLPSTDGPRVPTPTEELFLEYLLMSPSIREASEHAGVSPKTGYAMVSRLKDIIQERARDQLTMSTLKAVQVMSDSLSADASLEKGELKLKAAAEILDRSGITKHTNVEVSIESTNGIFLIPTKSVVPPEEPLEGDYEEYIEDDCEEFTEDDDGDLCTP